MSMYPNVKELAYKTAWKILQQRDRQDDLAKLIRRTSRSPTNIERAIQIEKQMQRNVIDFRTLRIALPELDKPQLQQDYKILQAIDRLIRRYQDLPYKEIIVNGESQLYNI